MYQWQKTVLSRNVEAWLSRLSSVDPERVAIVELPGLKSQSLQVFFDTEAEAAALAILFGGKVCRIRPESWLPAPATTLGQPLRIAGGRLLVTAQPNELSALRAAHPRSHVLCIPAAMAFGTGEHATTAMCLRLLVETGSQLAATPSWAALDLGMGSGILALAARQLGASHTLGLDNDKHAVRTARENATLNGLLRGVKFQQADLLHRWEPKPPHGWNVVVANLFSNLLVVLMPLMQRALAPTGYLIMSGILASQADEVVNAARSAGLTILTRRRRGKWVALLARPGVTAMPASIPNPKTPSTRSSRT